MELGQSAKKAGWYVRSPSKDGVYNLKAFCPECAKLETREQPD